MQFNSLPRTTRRAETAPDTGRLVDHDAVLLIGDQGLEERLRARGIPTRDDLQQIVAQLEALSDKLDALGKP